MRTWVGNPRPLSTAAVAPALYPYGAGRGRRPKFNHIPGEWVAQTAGIPCGGYTACIPPGPTARPKTPVHDPHSGGLHEKQEGISLQHPRTAAMRAAPSATSSQIPEQASERISISTAQLPPPPAPPERGAGGELGWGGGNRATRRRINPGWESPGIEMAADTQAQN